MELQAYVEQLSFKVNALEHRVAQLEGKSVTPMECPWPRKASEPIPILQRTHSLPAIAEELLKSTKD